MPILFLGRTNLRNDSIKELIRAKKGIKVNHITPQQLTSLVKENRSNNYHGHTTIVDLPSFELPPLKVISLVRETVNIDQLIVINGPGSESKLEPIIKIRVDYYLPYTFDIADLYRALDDGRPGNN